MVASSCEREPKITEQAELEWLERTLVEMCEHLAELVEKALERGAVESRETRLQLEAFEERRDRATEVLTDTQDGPLPVKIGNLERIVEALECSWAYFSSLAEAASFNDDSTVRIVGR